LDQFQNIYEGDTKVKGDKLQTLKAKFEQLKMKEDEYIASYFIQVDEVLNGIKVLGDEMKEEDLIQKVLISLPMRFDSKILALEERVDLSTLTMDELHGILIAYDMMIEKDNTFTKEA